MKLYYSKGACSLAVRIVMHEIGLQCEFEAVNLKTKQTQTGANFLEINPKGGVPTLVLDDNTILTENAVIQQYLADTFNATQLLPPLKDFQRYRVLEWLNFVSTDLHKGVAPLFNPNLAQEVKEVFKTNLKKNLQFLDNHLKQQSCLLDNKQFTLADGYLFVVLTWLPHFQINLNEYNNLARYFSELKDRPSIQQALTEEGLNK